MKLDPFLRFGSMYHLQSPLLSLVSTLPPLELAFVLPTKFSLPNGSALDNWKLLVLAIAFHIDMLRAVLLRPFALVSLERFAPLLSVHSLVSALLELFEVIALALMSNISLRIGSFSALLSLHIHDTSELMEEL